ncbi:uncharacterized protein PV07_06814 [Cladophialophora immunda]|uniref:Uncharacterized protein n=1 Tax=Cladophialophora immunda TaxID=569365 RepID=A0A0D2C7F3_9EURO|nr:uncharacterized protein PV07_06814 [Cladophialophora immunda]KIW27033.1 hypothetical protein PV07_06814 [Cladophialophora immunda]
MRRMHDFVSTNPAVKSSTYPTGLPNKRSRSRRTLRSAHGIPTGRLIVGWFATGHGTKPPIPVCSVSRGEGTFCQPCSEGPPPSREPMARQLPRFSWPRSGAYSLSILLSPKRALVECLTQGAALEKNRTVTGLNRVGRGRLGHGPRTISRWIQSWTLDHRDRRVEMVRTLGRGVCLGKGDISIKSDKMSS